MRTLIVSLWRTVIKDIRDLVCCFETGLLRHLEQNGALASSLLLGLEVRQSLLRSQCSLMRFMSLPTVLFVGILTKNALKGDQPSTRQKSFTS